MYDHRIGHWAFIASIAIAVLAGIVPEWQSVYVVWTLAVLGLVVGVLNITVRETTEFLMASITLLLVGFSGTLPALDLLTPKIPFVLNNIVAVVSPAALIVSLKALWALAQS